MKGVKVKCRFTVEYEVIVFVKDDECPIEKLSNKDIFRENTTGAMPSRMYSQFGLNSVICHENDVEVLSAFCYSDPEPTGQGYYKREWEIDEGGE